MKTRLALTLLGTALLSVPAAFGQATSGVVGFSSLACPAGASIVVPTLVNSSVYQGSAVISGSTVTPSTAPGWVVGAYNATSFTLPAPNYPRFYVEIVSGVNEGKIIDITSNNGTSLTLASPGPAGTFTVAIREHVTLDKVVQGAVGLSDITDSVDVYGSDGVSGTRVTRLYNAGTWMTDDFSYNAGHTVIYPGSGFILSATAPVTFNFMGEVKPTKTQINLYANAVNIVGPLSPASSQSLYNNSLATTMQPILDSFNTFTTNGSFTIQASYLSDGSQITDSTFTPLSPSSTDAIPLNRGIVVSVIGDAVWVNNSPIAP